MQRRNWHLSPCLHDENVDGIGQRQIYTLHENNSSAWKTFGGLDRVLGALAERLELAAQLRG